MSYSDGEIDELKKYCQSVSLATEGEHAYFMLEALELPEGCRPQVVDALLCPTPRDGYNSRLFFAQQVEGLFPRNWNGSVRVLERNWSAFSWKVQTPNLSLAEILARHLEGLIKAQ